MATPKKTQPVGSNQEAKKKINRFVAFFDRSNKKSSPTKKSVPPKAPKKKVAPKDKTNTSVKKDRRPVESDDSTQRYLPFTEIRDNIIYMKDGSARTVLRVDPVNFSLKSEEEQDAIIYGYQRFLNSLRFPVQIMVQSQKVDIDSYIDRLDTLANGQKNVLLKDQTRGYIDFLRNLINRAQIMRKDFYIVIPHDEVDNISVKDDGFVGIFRSFFRGINQNADLTKIRAHRIRVDDLRRKVHDKAGIVRGALE